MHKTGVEIIYQNNDVLVINKPAGVSVTKDRTGNAQLSDILAPPLGGAGLADQSGPQIHSDLRLVHRLDKDTSGVMILAKNVRTQSRFSGYFEKRLIKKIYLAIVTGFVRGQEGTIKTALAPNPKDPALMCITARRGKEAITRWKLLADFGTISLLAVMPLTGRTHQIRVHLASIGLPVAIDPLYGSGQPLLLSDFKAGYHLRKGQIERPLIERLTLHAYQLVIPAEAGIQPDCFIAGLDKKFKATIKMLTKHNPRGPNAFIDSGDFSKIINAERL